MSWRGWVLGAGGVLLSAGAFAQTDLQKFELDRVSFQYRTNNDNPHQRCLVWYPYDGVRPTIQYGDRSEPFLVMKIRARVRQNCNVKITPAESVTVLDSREGDRVFEVIVNPPATFLRAEGPNFRDEIILEAPVRQFNGVGFFDFFARSRVYFEARSATLSTDNTRNPTDPRKLFPVFGGSLVFPLPWVSSIFLGYSMFQNLGNLGSTQENPVQYSEFAFDARYTYRGPKSWGSPYGSIIGEYRGRTVYQLAQTKRSFVIGSTATPGFGFELGGFPGILKYPDRHWATRIGLDLAWRRSLGVSGLSYASTMLEGVLSYRLSSKWALGLGYSKISQQSDFSQSEDPTVGIVHEGVSNLFLRLTLLSQEEP